MYRFNAHSQSMPLHRGFAPSFIRPVQQPDGKVKEVLVSSAQSLPEAKDFDLDNLIKAGIPLQRYNTKVVVSGTSEVENILEQININSQGENK